MLPERRNLYAAKKVIDYWQSADGLDEDSQVSLVGGCLLAAIAAATSAIQPKDLPDFDSYQQEVLVDRSGARRGTVKGEKGFTHEIVERLSKGRACFIGWIGLAPKFANIVDDLASSPTEALRMISEAVGEDYSDSYILTGVMLRNYYPDNSNLELQIGHAITVIPDKDFFKRSGQKYLKTEARKDKERYQRELERCETDEEREKVTRLTSKHLVVDLEVYTDDKFSGAIIMTGQEIYQRMSEQDPERGVPVVEFGLVLTKK